MPACQRAWVDAFPPTMVRCFGFRAAPATCKAAIYRFFTCQTANQSSRIVRRTVEQFARPISLSHQMGIASLHPSYASSIPRARSDARLTVPAARPCARVRQIVPLLKQRAQGMPGAPCAHSLACKTKKHTSKSTAGRRFARHSPRNGFTASSALSLVNRAFLPPSLATMQAHRHQLDASVGASGPHGFAVREPRPRQLRKLASIASRPTLVTIRETPLPWDGMADSLLLFLPRRQVKFGKSEIDQMA